MDNNHSDSICYNIDMKTTEQANNMKYYFDTEEQIKGDKAYNKMDYQLALSFYQKGLNKLNTSSPSSPSFKYYDGLAYIASEILITMCAQQMSIFNPIEASNTNERWKELPSLLSSLEMAYAKIISYEKRQTTNEKIVDVYTSLAQAFEHISDAFFDDISIDENKPSTVSKIEKSLFWLSKANQYKEKAGLPVLIEAHLAYLNLQERKYSYVADPRVIQKMQQYIKQHQLLETESSWMNQLEALYYQLWVTVKRPDGSAHQYAERCKTLLDTHADELNEDIPIFHELRTLINSLPEMGQTKHKLDESDTSSQSLKRQKLERTEENTIIKPHAIPHTEPKSNHSPFFSSVQSQEQESTQEIISESFIQMMNELGSKYNNAHFFSNVLSLMGDFYRSDASLKLNNFIAADLYKAALRISPQHKVASPRLKKLKERDRTLRNSPDSIASNSPVQNDNFSIVFSVAIDNHISEMSAYIPEPDKLHAKLNQLLTSLEETATKYNVFRDSSKDIVDFMKTRYQEIYNEKNNPASHHSPFIG